MKLLKEIISRVGHCESFLKELNLTEFPLRIIEQNLISPCADDQSLKVHDLILYDYSQFLETQGQYRGLEAFWIGEVDA